MEVRDCPPLVFFAHRDAPALLAEYAAEASIAGLPAPQPDERSYFRLEANGVLHPLAAYDADERMVGFIVLLVSLNPHYGVKLGVIESFFVASEHRGSGAGLRLLRAAEACAEAQGAAGLLVSAPIKGRLADVLDAHDAYNETNRVFFRSFARDTAH